MKKVFIALVVVLGLIIAGLVVITTVDFNRLGKDHVYVQIISDGEEEKTTISSGEVFLSYWYDLTAYDENGNPVQVKFTP